MLNMWEVFGSAQKFAFFSRNLYFILAKPLCCCAQIFFNMVFGFVCPVPDYREDIQKMLTVWTWATVFIIGAFLLQCSM